MQRRPLTFLTRISREFGDVTRFTVTRHSAWFVNHPDLVHQILVADSAKFVKGRALERARIVMGEGLLTSDGDKHRRQRRLSQPAFHRQRLRTYAETMAQAARERRDAWRDGDEFDAVSEMMSLTLVIVGRALFSMDVADDAQRVRDALAVLVASFNRIMMPMAPLLLKLPLPANRRMLEAKQTLDDIILRLARERRASGRDSGDLLSTLVFAEDADHPGEHLDDEEVRDQLMSIFLAGHETTALTLTWFWWLLARHPDVEVRLQAELASVLGGREPGPDDLRNLPFTEKVIKETLRLYPPGWAIGRRAIAPLTLGGFPVAENTFCLTSPYVMQRDPRFYAHPDAFDPDRWTPEFAETLPKFAFFPFGGGPRTCIGEGFAWMELILVVATLAQRWRLHLLPGPEPTPVAGITLRPGRPIRMRLQRRPG